MHTVFLLENLKGKGHSKDIVVDGRAILKWILGIWDGMRKCGMDSSDSG
jgi:hypothetical protein